MFEQRIILWVSDLSLGILCITLGYSSHYSFGQWTFRWDWSPVYVALTYFPAYYFLGSLPRISEYNCTFESAKGAEGNWTNASFTKSSMSCISLEERVAYLATKSMFSGMPLKII